MPEKKKQHFVSKFLYKRFATDAAQLLINLYQTKSNKIIYDIPLKDQSQEDYYYGSDLIFEEYLGITESAAAPVIEEMIANEYVPRSEDLKFRQLLHFIMLYEWRTKASVQNTENYLNEMFREVAKYDARLKPFDFENNRLKHKEPAAFNLAYYMESWVVATDLEPFLLINLTDQLFVISDNPLIKYNPYMQDRTCYWASNSILSKGLIYLFPISPRHYIMLIDPATYDVLSTENNLIIIEDSSDVDQINLLQGITADRNLYFTIPEQEDYLKDLAGKIANNKIDKVEKQLLDNPKKPGSKSLFAYQLYHKLSFFFSFIRTGEAAKIYDTSKQLFHPRNQNMVDFVQDLSDKKSNLL